MDDAKKLQILFDNSIVPDQDEINDAAEDQHICSLGWFLEHKMCPDQEGINLSVKQHHAHSLELLIKYGLFPNQEGANYIVIDDPYEKEPDIKLHEIVHKSRCDHTEERLKMLNILYEHGVIPSSESANYCANIEILKWLIDHGVKLTSECANYSADKANIEALEMLAKHGILPDCRGANCADVNKHKLEETIKKYTSALEWMKKRFIVTHDGGLESDSDEDDTKIISTSLTSGGIKLANDIAEFLEIKTDKQIILYLDSGAILLNYKDGFGKTPPLYSVKLKTYKPTEYSPIQKELTNNLIEKIKLFVDDYIEAEEIDEVERECRDNDEDESCYVGWPDMD